MRKFFKIITLQTTKTMADCSRPIIILAAIGIMLLSGSGCHNKSEKAPKKDAVINPVTDLSRYNIRTGLIYRNPKPHVFSKQAYFPSVAVLGNGEMLASFAIGEAFEAANSDTYIVRSKDMGETWSEPERFLKKDKNTLVSNYARIAAMPDGSVIANVIRSHRESHPEDGLANPVNIGFVPTDLMLVRSKDFGKTWEEPELLTPPLAGPSFEMCSPIVHLSNGRWLWPTSTWRGWDGYCPNGMKMGVLVSSDNGKTWPEFIDVMNRSNEKIIFWESKIVELSEGVLLAAAWAYDEGQGKDLPDQYTLSHDGGKTWMVPASTNIMGETMAITRTPDGKVLSVYRRMDKPGLWITIVRIEGDKWINEDEIPLWGVQEKSLTDKSDNMVKDFNELKFGAPCITILPDKTVYIAFWCYEKMVSNIRWFKLNI
jgi:sialidase-1